MSNPLAATLKDILDEALDQLDISRGDEQVSLPIYRRVLQIARTSSSSIDKSRPNFYEVTIRNQDTRNRLMDVVSQSLNEYISDNKIQIAAIQVSGGPTSGVPMDDLLKKTVELAVALGSDRASTIFIDSLESSECLFGNYTLVGGVTTENPIQIFDGIRLVPLPNVVQSWPDNLPTFLPDSELQHRFRKAAFLEEDWTVSPRFMLPEDYLAGISLTSADSPFITKATSQQAQEFNPYMFCAALSLVIRRKAYLSMQWRSMADDELVNLQGTTSFQYVTVQSPEERVDIAIEQIEEAKELYQSLKKINSKTLRKLEIPLSRLVESTSRPQLVDRIIDLAIALESLYLPDEDTELGFRLRLRAAKHMEESFDGRRATAQRIRAFYKARSDAVHTGRVNHEYKVAKKKKVPILDLTASVQDVCRSSIIKILKDRKMPDWTRLDLK